MIRVKICGITNREDALFTATTGADMLGFVFHDKSPRNVEPETVRGLVSDVKGECPEILCVGLFVDEPADFVRDVSIFCGLDLVQLHGKESPQVVSEFGGLAYKAIRPRTVRELEDGMARYAVGSSMPDLLIDTYSPDKPGGTGQVGDWSLAARASAKRRVLLAGGLTPHNVAEAVRAVRPWGVDVSSGVEAEPGRKSHPAVSEFISAVRRAERELDSSG